MSCKLCGEPAFARALCPKHYHSEAKAGHISVKSHTPEYYAWANMHRRCLTKHDESYYLYGGRGITVCERWLNNFDNFLSDMGPRPSPEYSLDRIDNGGNYTPSNCRWASKQEQVANRRTCYITAARLEDLLKKEKRLASYENPS